MTEIRNRKRPVPSHFRVYVAGRLQELREAQGLRQIEVAELAHLRRDRLNKYEHGLQPPPAFALYSVAQALGRPVDLFLPEPKLHTEGDQIFYAQIRRAWDYSPELRLGLGVMIRAICDCLDHGTAVQGSRPPKEARHASRS